MREAAAEDNNIVTAFLAMTGGVSAYVTDHRSSSGR